MLRLMEPYSDSHQPVPLLAALSTVNLAEDSEHLQHQEPRCLCVDLDGTLVRSDTLMESFLAVVRANPTRIPQILMSLYRGKAKFKQQLERAAHLNPDALPYSRPVLDYIQSEAKNGRRLFLVTGADASVAVPVAEHLGLFTGVICSDGLENVTGATKLDSIRRLLGHQDFSYVGNSRDDLPVWKAAKSAVVVGANRRVREVLQISGVRVEKIISGPQVSMHAIAKAMRVHQWIKNLLVLLPVFLGHHVLEIGTMFSAVRAFFAFSFCASALYVINDLLDLPADRRHTEKRLRPLAAGELSIVCAILVSAVLLVSSAILNPTRDAAMLLALYCVSVLSYSLYLKRLLMLDVILLAGFYTLRLLYGGLATKIGVSIWTLAFSIFMFLSLALIKRICELRLRSSEEGLTGSRRGYLFADLPQLTALCAASGSISALIVVLYVRSPDVAPLYARPYLLLGIFPLLAYWHSRLLILANRGLVQGDPIVFSLFDRASQIVAIAVLLIIAAAI